MFAFPSMLVPAAEAAGMKVPPDPDKFDRNKYVHFAVFCTLRLCRPMQMGEHWENAKIIAAVHENDLKLMTLQDFLQLGLRWQS